MNKETRTYNLLMEAEKKLEEEYLECLADDLMERFEAENSNSKPKPR